MAVWGIDPATRSIDLSFSYDQKAIYIRDGVLVGSDDPAHRDSLWVELYIDRSDLPEDAFAPKLVVWHEDNGLSSTPPMCSTASTRSGIFHPASDRRGRRHRSDVGSYGREGAPVGVSSAV